MSATSGPTVLIVLDSTSKGDFADALLAAEPRIEPALVRALVRQQVMMLPRPVAPQGRNPYVAPKQRAPKTIGRPPRR